MSDANLCVKNCDKCGKMIEKTQDVFIVSYGTIVL